MLPGDIRRYKQSSFPPLSPFADNAKTGQANQASSVPRLPGIGGQAETRLPQIGNKVPLVALSQEARNNSVQSKRSAKYATDARRERAPERHHTNRGKRSRGIVDSDLHHKTGPVGGQNSKPPAKQKGRLRKHAQTCDSSSSGTIDESERFNLENLSDSKRLVAKRRHKSHERESPCSVHVVDKVEQRSRTKSYDRSSSKTTKSLLEMKNELRKDSRDIKPIPSNISIKKKQRTSSHVSDERKDKAPITSKPQKKKQRKCIMVKHSKKSTPMWVGNIPAESWEKDCMLANNLTQQVKVHKKEDVSGTDDTKKWDRFKKPEAQKRTETNATKSDTLLKANSSTEQRMSKRSLKINKKYEDAIEENENTQTRFNVRKKVKQNEKCKSKQSIRHIKRSNERHIANVSPEPISDSKVNRSKAGENIRSEKSKLVQDINFQISYNETMKTKKGMKSCISKETIPTSHDSRLVRGNSAGKIEQNGGNDKNKWDEQVINKQNHNERQLGKHKNDTENTQSEKEACMKRMNGNGTMNTDRSRIISSSEETKQDMNVRVRSTNKITSKLSRPDSSKSSGRLASGKSMNTMPSNKLHGASSMTSTVDSHPSHVSKLPVSDKRRRTPTSKRSVTRKDTACTPRPGSGISNEGQVYKPNLKKNEREVLGKSSGFGRVTPVAIESTTSKRTTPTSKTLVTSTQSSTRIRPNLSETSGNTKSTAYVGGDRGSRNSSTKLPRPSSSRSSLPPVSVKSSSKDCTHETRKKVLARSASNCGKPLSTKSMSGIPVHKKSASSVSTRPTTKSASYDSDKQAAVKPISPELNRTCSANIPLQVSGRSSVAKPEYPRPASSKHDTPSSMRQASRNDSGTSLKRKSAIPVSVRSTSTMSVGAERTTLSSASRSLCANYRPPGSQVSVESSASSIRTCISQSSRRAESVKSNAPSTRTSISRAPSKSVSVQPNAPSIRTCISRAPSNSVSVKSSTSSIRTCISRASSKSMLTSVSTYNDDFEYESAASSTSASVSENNSRYNQFNH